MRAGRPSLLLLLLAGCCGPRAPQAPPVPATSSPVLYVMERITQLSEILLVLPGPDRAALVMGGRVDPVGPAEVRWIDVPGAPVRFLSGTFPAWRRALREGDGISWHELPASLDGLADALGREAEVLRSWRDELARRDPALAARAPLVRFTLALGAGQETDAAAAESAVRAAYGDLLGAAGVVREEGP